MSGEKQAFEASSVNSAKILEIVEKQNQWRKHETLNLIASENITSPSVDKAYCSDFSHRYAEGDPYHRYYNGTKYVDEVESIALELAKKLFRATHVDLKPISGTVANFAAFGMFGRAGDTILSSSTANGGHVSHNFTGAPGLMGMHVLNFPAAEDGYHIDVDKTIKLIEVKAQNPLNHLSLVLFGRSLFLFPDPVKEISPAAHANNLKVMYDAAHVLGLVAGGEFQNPLGEGADLMTASTHKTFFGPQGGIVLSNMPEKDWARCKPLLFPGVTSNHHLHRLPALAIAFLEFLSFGRDYAKQVVANSQALARELNERGFHVECEEFGFTKSHQVAVNVRDLGGGQTVANALEENNVIVNKNILPCDKITQANLLNPSGIRIGVQEMTRVGMKQNEMEEIAGIFEKILLKKVGAKKEVSELRARFQEVHYAFK